MSNLHQVTHHDLRAGLKLLTNLDYLDVLGTNDCQPAFVIGVLHSNPRMQTFHRSTYEALIDYKHLFDKILYGGLPPYLLNEREEE